MNALLETTNPKAISFTLKISMKLEEWILLKGQLKENSWPSNELFEHIQNMISQAEHTYYPEVVEK